MLIRLQVSRPRRTPQRPLHKQCTRLTLCFRQCARKCLSEKAAKLDELERQLEARALLFVRNSEVCAV